MHEPEHVDHERRICPDCQRSWLLSEGEIAFMVQRNLALPRRCPSCRRARGVMRQRPVRKARVAQRPPHDEIRERRWWTSAGMRRARSDRQCLNDDSGRPTPRAANPYEGPLSPHSIVMDPFASQGLSESACQPMLEERAVRNDVSRCLTDICCANEAVRW